MLPPHANFCAPALSSLFGSSEGPFGHLSSSLRREIREEVFLPMLLEVKLFGHSKADQVGSGNS